MKAPLYHVDAFARRLFGGNPAAVVPLDTWLPDDVLQAIAAENNLSETAFVLPREDPAPLRWFSPALEVDLCGHATLATAYVLLTYYHPSASEVTFSTRSGLLSVSRRAGQLVLDFPSRPGTPVPVSDALASALRARPREAYLSRDLLAIFDTEDEVRSLHPDIGQVAALDVFAVIASAPGVGTDFVLRFFGPRAGIPEDPATGSAHCTLVPYWGARLGKSALTAHQVSRRGGEFRCELRGDRIGIGGAVAEYLRGEISIPDV